MTRVLIAASAPVVRAGLRAMLSGEGAEVVAEAPSLYDLSANAPHADVLVVAEEQLVEEQARALAGDGEIGIVALADSSGPAGVLSALRLRGWSIVPTDAPAPELYAAVEAAAQGLVALSLPLADRLLGSGAGAVGVMGGAVSRSGRLEGDVPAEPLTARETEVLELLSQGLSNKLIARRLQISEHTVKFHVSSIYTKLGASSRTEAVSLGARHGLIAL